MMHPEMARDLSRAHIAELTCPPGSRRDKGSRRNIRIILGWMMVETGLRLLARRPTLSAAYR